MKKRHENLLDKKATRRPHFLVRALFAFFVVCVQVGLPVAPVFGDELIPSSSEGAIRADKISEKDTEETEEGVVSVDMEQGETPESADQSQESTNSLTTRDRDVGVDTDTDSIEEATLEVSQVSSIQELSTGTWELTERTQENTEKHTTGDDILESETEIGEYLVGMGDEASSSSEMPEVEPTFEIPEELVPSEDTSSLEENDEGATTSPQPEKPHIDTTKEEVSPTENDGVPTTTEHVVQLELHTVAADEHYAFTEQECARVADGSFYCSRESLTPKLPIEDSVYAALDQTGDSEIFIQKDGTTWQVTANNLDDAAPFYDARSETIVFHRLVDARYQIVSYDLNTEKEEQVTFDSYNNMQPTRVGDTTVWQGWVGNDWEIFMKDGEEITMLTDNTSHDIGPRINGGYIIWQAEKEDGWQVRVYNTDTGLTESIDETNGASIENPRLVLVYDAKHENGDIETRGYDLVTGENVALAAEAQKLPKELPDPDQTGEDRALISQIQQKTKTEDEEGDSESDPIIPVLPPGEDEEMTLDLVILPLNINTQESTTSVEFIPNEIQALIVEDLVIPPWEGGEVKESIPELVIPAFIESTTQGDSQE